MSLINYFSVRAVEPSSRLPRVFELLNPETISEFILFLAEQNMDDEIRSFETYGGITPLEKYTATFALMARYAPNFNRKQRKSAYRHLSLYQLLILMRRLRHFRSVPASRFTEELEYVLIQ